MSYETPLAILCWFLLAICAAGFLSFTLALTCFFLEEARKEHRRKGR